MVDHARILRRGRQLMRNAELHRDAYLVLDLLLAWRQRDQGEARVTLSALARALRMGRARVLDMLGQLERARLLTKHRTRVWVPAWRKLVQGVNRYVFAAPPPEFHSEPTPIQAGIKRAREGSPIGRAGTNALLDALARLGNTLGVLEDGLVAG